MLPQRVSTLPLLLTLPWELAARRAFGTGRADVRPLGDTGSMGDTWTTDHIPDLTGRTYVVTGATSGLGIPTAVELARHGAEVVVTGRDPAKLTAALEQVKAAASAAGPSGQALDLADLASVRAAAAEIVESHPVVHVLVNNAGVMATPYRKTADGFELQIGTNHLGHFALTGLLLPAMPTDDPTADARVVTVASTAHRGGRVDPDDLNFERRRYQAWSAYGQSKLANLLFTAELARRAHAAGMFLKAVAAHPGWSATNLQYAGPKMAQNVVGRAGVRVMNAVVGQSAANGALPTLFAATDPTITTNEYIGPDGPFEIRGHPKRVGRSAAAMDTQKAAALWEVSEGLTDVRYP